MRKEKKTVTLTTVCVDVPARDRINVEAERLGLSQRQMVGRLVEAYELSLQRDEKKSSPPVDTQSLVEMLERVLKRDDRIVGFIKTQEAELLKPILAYIQRVEAEMRTLTNLIKQFQ